MALTSFQFTFHNNLFLSHKYLSHVRTDRSAIGEVKVTSGPVMTKVLI